MKTGDSDMRRGRVLAALVIGGAVVVTAGCGKAPPVAPPAALPPSITIVAPAESKVTASMRLVASPDVNQSDPGQQSLVVVRVYQLRTDTLFAAADYFALIGDDQKALGQELVSRDEYTLGASETVSRPIVLAGDTRFVGVFAAFRDNRNSQWRALIPVPKKGFAATIERARVVLTATE